MSKQEMIIWLVANHGYKEEAFDEMDSSEVATIYLPLYYEDIEELMNDNSFIAEGFGEE